MCEGEALRFRDAWDAGQAGTPWAFSGSGADSAQVERPTSGAQTLRVSLAHWSDIQPDDTVWLNIALGPPVAMGGARRPFGFERHGHRREDRIALDQGVDAGGLLGRVAGQVAERPHWRRSRAWRRASAKTAASIFSTDRDAPCAGGIVKTSSGRVAAKAGARFGSAPSAVSLTRSQTPASQSRRSWFALGRIACPLVETVLDRVRGGLGHGAGSAEAG